MPIRSFAGKAGTSGASRLRGTARSVRNRLFGRGPAIVVYHRVADSAVDPWGLAVSPRNFERQIAAMARKRSILSISQCVEALRHGSLPRDAVALSFDDGYADNALVAAPILEANHASATLFVATRPTLDGAAAYWWDELLPVLDAPACAAQISIGSVAVSFDLSEREPLDDDRAGWRAWEPRTARERLHWQLWSAMVEAPADDRSAALVQVRRLFGSKTDPANRPMSRDEARALFAGTAFAPAAHTRDHCDLTVLSGKDLADQLHGASEDLRELCGRAPEGFAYPFGRFDARCRDAVADAGFAWACTTRADRLHDKADRFLLPRVAAPDVPGIGWLR